MLASRLLNGLKLKLILIYIDYTLKLLFAKVGMLWLEKISTKTPANKTKPRKTTKKKLHNLPKISELMLHNSKLVAVYISKLYKHINIGTTLLWHEIIQRSLTMILVTHRVEGVCHRLTLYFNQHYQLNSSSFCMYFYRKKQIYTY